MDRYIDAVMRDKNEEIAKLQSRVRELEEALKEVKSHLDPTDDWMGDVTFWEYINQALKGGA